MVVLPAGVAALVAAGAVTALASTAVFYTMIAKVNRKLPGDQQVGYAVLLPAKALQIPLVYQRLCPEGRLNTARIALQATCLALMVAAAVLVRGA